MFVLKCGIQTHFQTSSSDEIDTKLGLLALQINAVTWWILAVGIWKILMQKQVENNK